MRFIIKKTLLGSLIGFVAAILALYIFGTLACTGSTFEGAGGYEAMMLAVIAEIALPIAALLGGAIGFIRYRTYAASPSITGLKNRIIDIIRSRGMGQLLYWLLGLLVAAAALAACRTMYLAERAKVAASEENLDYVMWHGSIDELQKELQKAYASNTISQVFAMHVETYCRRKDSCLDSESQADEWPLTRKKLAILLDHGADANYPSPELPILSIGGMRSRGPDVELLKDLLEHNAVLNITSSYGKERADFLIDMIEKDSRYESLRPLIRERSQNRPNHAQDGTR